MYALISGQAGLAVVVRGHEASILRIDKKEEEGGYTADSVAYFLRDALDVERLSDQPINEVCERLRIKWSLDRALRLIRVVLDPTEDDEGVVEALDCAVDLLSADLAQAILARLCIAPVGDEQVLLRAVELPRQK